MTDHLRLLQPRTAFVEPVNPSGETKSGIWVYDHDNAKAMDGKQISLLQRVLAVHPTCAYIRPGMVVGISNPYAYATLTHEGVDYRVIHEQNVEYHLEGYDEEREGHDPDDYGVCLK